MTSMTEKGSEHLTLLKDCLIKPANSLEKSAKMNYMNKK